MSFLHQKALLFLPFVLAGCAAQSSYSLMKDAREKVEQARKLNPRDTQVARAEVALEAGQDQLRESKYGKAEHNFLTAIQLSERVIKQNEAPKAADLQPEPLPQLTPEQLAIASAPTAQETQDKLDRMSLPREALAKYLADKRKATAAKSGASVQQMPLPREASVEVAVIPKSENRPIPAVPGNQRIQPLGSEDQLGGAEPIELEPLKRVARGRINFDPNLSKLSDPAMSQLDGLAQFLIENPSNTLLVTPTLATNELENMSMDRFQQISDYLKARGVPDDQIRLDNMKKMGSAASLELFLIDH